MLIVGQICDGRRALRAGPCVSSRAHLHTLARSLFWLRLRHNLLPTSLLILLLSSSEPSVQTCSGIVQFRVTTQLLAQWRDETPGLISGWGDFINWDPGPARWHAPSILTLTVWPCQHGAQLTLVLTSGPCHVETSKSLTLSCFNKVASHFSSSCCCCTPSPSIKIYFWNKIKY